MRMKSIGGFIAVSVLLLFTVGSYAGQYDSGQSSAPGSAQTTASGSDQTTATGGDQAAASEKIASAFLPVTNWEFDPVVDGKAVTHDFVIQNKGNAPLNISKVKTG